MDQVVTIGLDIAKSVFQVHGVDSAGAVVMRQRLTRARMLAFFAKKSPCLVGLEACGSAHYWGRELTRLGHEVRLIPPSYVKPYVKRQKNDAADAEAICEAAQRPSMRFVAIKDEEQQASGVVFRARDVLVRQRTQCINALRGHLTEYGWVVPKGATHVPALIGDYQNFCVRNVNGLALRQARDVTRLVMGWTRHCARSIDVPLFGQSVCSSVPACPF